MIYDYEIDLTDTSRINLCESGTQMLCLILAGCMKYEAESLDIALNKNRLKVSYNARGINSEFAEIPSRLVERVHQAFVSFKDIMLDKETTYERSVHSGLMIRLYESCVIAYCVPANQTEIRFYFKGLSGTTVDLSVWLKSIHEFLAEPVKRINSCEVSSLLKHT